MSNELEIRLKGCFQTVFPDLGEDAISSASQATVGAWDSIATVTLVTLIDQEFGIQLDLDRLLELDSFERFLESVQDLANVS